MKNSPISDKDRFDKIKALLKPGESIEIWNGCDRVYRCITTKIFDLKDSKLKGFSKTRIVGVRVKSAVRKNDRLR